MTIRLLLSRRRNKTDGATMAEFALGYPILVLLIMFHIDAGLYLFQKTIVTDTTALLNRAIVTQLGQREAEAANCNAVPTPLGCPVLVPDCDDLVDIAKDKKNVLKVQKGILFDGMTFELKISTRPEIPFRLITTTGSKPFQCLTCKFFAIGIPAITHRSVLVIERPNFGGQTCNPPAATPFSAPIPEA